MEEFSMPQSILQIVSEKGFDGLREIMQMLFNEAMKMERDTISKSNIDILKKYAILYYQITKWR